jgi:uncharacterized SAM-binding protein YcdF (DUF218 family)
VSDVVSFVFSAGGIVAWTLACTIALTLRPTSSRPRQVLLAVAVLYLLASMPIVANLTSEVLLIGRVPFQRTDVPPGRTAIVVLGSGSVTVRNWDAIPYSTVDPWAASRVLEASRVFRAIDAGWIISSGGHARRDDPAVPTGESMRDALVQLGVPLDRIVVETRSRDTHEEAIVVAPMLHSMQVDHVVLVTSDTHMLRSICAFRAAGVDAIPAIARNPYADDPRQTRFRPGHRGLQASSAIAHEIFGIAYYAARGWCRF